MTTYILRAVAVFCVILGLAYGLIKLRIVTPKAVYAAPALALIYLGSGIFQTIKRRTQKSEVTNDETVSLH